MRSMLLTDKKRDFKINDTWLTKKQHEFDNAIVAFCVLLGATNNVILNLKHSE